MRTRADRPRAPFVPTLLLLPSPRLKALSCTGPIGASHFHRRASLRVIVICRWASGGVAIGAHRGRAAGACGPGGGGRRAPIGCRLCNRQVSGMEVATRPGVTPSRGMRIHNEAGWRAASRAGNEPTAGVRVTRSRAGRHLLGPRRLSGTGRWPSHVRDRGGTDEMATLISKLP